MILFGRHFPSEKTKTGRFKSPFSFLPQFLLFAGLVLALYLVSSMFPESSDAYPPGIMPSKYVKEGMRGYGLTVFKGNRIERFPVVVMGKLKTHIAESDLILIRMLGGYPVQHQTGIIAGMSGSPVYINGKLIGAIGYGWGFTKEPIGGVTPIESMLREMPGKKIKTTAQDMSDFKPAPSREFSLDSPLIIDGKNYNQVVLSSSFQPDASNYSSDTMVLSPVASLLQVQGFSDKGLEMIKDKLEPFGFKAVAVPGGGRIPKNVDYEMKPGSAVGISFIEGDLFMGGTGTVTYRSGDTILAFGHPMMQLGQIKFPLNSVYIQGIMPSLTRPFKFSSSTGVVGTLVEDRLYAVAGNLGQKPPQIPVMIDVVDQQRKWKKRFNMKAIDHKYLTPMFVSMAGYESLTSSAAPYNNRAAKIKYAIKLKGYDKIEFEDFAGGMLLQSEVSLQLMRYLKTLSIHDFDPVQIEKFYMKIDILPEYRQAAIEEISTQLPGVAPGDNLDIKIRLKTADGKTIIKNATIPVPPDLKKGSIRIGVTGGSNIVAFRKKMRMLPLKPYNYSQLVYQVLEEDRGNDLVIAASFPRQTLGFAGETMDTMANSKIAMFVSTPSSNSIVLQDSYKTDIKMPYKIDGEQFITVRVGLGTPSKKSGFDAVQEQKDLPDTPKENNHQPKPLSDIESKIHKLMGNDTHMIAVATASAKPSDKSAAKTAVDTGSRSTVLSDPRDYFRGRFENTSITNGIITLGHSYKNMYFSKNPFILAMAHDESTGKVYAVESPSGYLLEISNGDKTIIGKTREVLLPCMVRDKSGIIYVGSAPHGKIYRHLPDGTFTEFCALKDKIVWDLKLEPSGNLLAATGNSGKVYRITPDGKVKVIFDAPVRHVQCLELGPDGEIYAGTANEGIVYQISTDGKVKPVFSSLGDSVDVLLYDKGSLWVGSEDLLYKVGTSGGKKVYIFPETGIIDLKKGKDGTLLVGTANMGRVYRILEGDRIENLYESDINQVMKLEETAAGEVLIATSNPGKILKLNNSYSQSGTYVTKVIDTGRASDFGNIQWQANSPQGCAITFQTRSGETSNPDKTWSEWSPEYTMTEGQKILSPSGRFIQVRANFKSGGEKTPELFTLSVFYKNRNHAPVMMLDEPNGGEKWSGSKKIKWKAYIANTESLSFSLFYSLDYGKTWKAVKQNLEAVIKKSKGSNPKPVEQDYSWNTKALKDGVYMIKLKGFDRTDAFNPDLTGEVISKPFVVSNKKPEVTILSSEDLGDRALITGFVKCYNVNAGSVQYKLNKAKTWSLAYPRDGIFDNGRETFVIYLNKPFPSKFSLTVKATDEAGNSVEESKSISISKKKPDKKEDKDTQNNDAGNTDDNGVKTDNGKSGRDSNSDSDTDSNPDSDEDTD